MAVTFTNLNFKMSVSYENAAAVFKALLDLQAAGAGQVLNIEAQAHVTGSNLEEVKAALQTLEDAGALSNYRHNELLQQIRSFEALYLK